MKTCRTSLVMLLALAACGGPSSPHPAALGSMLEPPLDTGVGSVAPGDDAGTITAPKPEASTNPVPEAGTDAVTVSDPPDAGDPPDVISVMAIDASDAAPDAGQIVLADAAPEASPGPEAGPTSDTGPTTWGCDFVVGVPSVMGVVMAHFSVASTCMGNVTASFYETGAASRTGTGAGTLTSTVVTASGTTTTFTLSCASGDLRVEGTSGTNAETTIAACGACTPGGC